MGAHARKETRSFTGRHFPARITLGPTAGGAALFDWEYTTDAVGNPTEQDDLVASQTRTFDYQDHQYFLTDAVGPWPGPLAWTYDRIGHSLARQRGGRV